ncbi:hypothetical protein ID866_2709 [Astraeus odoratus]|nr:hypothetical protein ID866_2709 [Astraeus odoratus]
MATWLLGSIPWHLPIRARIPLDALHSRLWSSPRSHFSAALQAPSPASIEVESMPYPQSRPDPSVFEDMTEEYSSVSSLGPSVFTPLSSSETLASLVRRGDFKAADTLRQEMIAHQIPIVRDGLYQRAALHAIRERRPHVYRARDRLQSFDAWMALVPDRQEKACTFYAVRQHIFRSMDHLNLEVVHRFGLVLAAKGYFCNAAVLQVVATLAQYAQPGVTESFLQRLDAQCRTHAAGDSAMSPESLMEAPFNMAIKKHALVRRTTAALRLIEMAHERGVRASDDTLDIVLKHAPDKQRTAEKIRMRFPAYTSTLPVQSNASISPSEPGSLRERLRVLRQAFTSPRPPSPYALLRFVTDYRTLGRFRAISLLRKCAFRHSFASASTWVLAEMLYHRERREHLRTLAAFAKYFHLVGVPRKTVLSLLRGSTRKSIRPSSRTFGFGVGMNVQVHFPPYPLKQRLWPSSSHTALVWEALVTMSKAHERKRLYALLLQLVERTRQHDGPSERTDAEGALAFDAPGRPQKSSLELPPTSFDAAHFSPFIQTHAARGRPDRAAQVIADMVARGIQPGIKHWSMLARGYAQDGDANMAFKILDHLEAAERSQMEGGAASGGAGAGEGTAEGVRCTYGPSDDLLGTHTNVLRGFVLGNDVEHAREVNLRLLERCGYQPGTRPATDDAIELLGALEAARKT